MVVKSKLESKHVNDLGNIFEILRRHRLQLNASKCSFGVGLGKFLGYMVIHCGIEVNHDQIIAINNLTGMTTTLNRFISWSTDKYRPFF